MTLDQYSNLQIQPGMYAIDDLLPSGKMHRPEDVEAQLPLYDFSMEITPADAAGLQRTADFMAAQGMMERPIDVRSLFAAPRP